MPTVITHAIVGSSIAIFGPASVSLWRLGLVLAVLPVLPDLDVIAFRFGIPYEHMFGHRGFTHSIFFALLMAVVVPALLFRKEPAFSKSWLLIVLMCFLSTLSHGILDAFTDAGLGVGFFIPFDDSRYFFPWRPIATSPLSISAFLGERGVSILANELYWIGIPLLVAIGTGIATRSLVRRTQKGGS